MWEDEEEKNRIEEEMGLAEEIEREATDLSNSLPEEPVRMNLSDLMNKYNDLRDARNTMSSDMGNITMLQGGNQIAQAIASGRGAKIGAGEAGVQALQNQAKSKLDAAEKDLSEAGSVMSMEKQLQGLEQGDMTLQHEREMNDRDSDISKFYREQAYNILSKLSPDSKLTGQLENMSANQLMKIPGLKNALQNQGIQKYQQSQFISRLTGDPFSYDPMTNSYKNTITGEPPKSGELVRPVAYQDSFGNRQYVSPTGNVTLQDSRIRPGQEFSTEQIQTLPPEQRQQKEQEIVQTFKPDKEQREEITKEKGRLDTLTKNVNEKMSAASRILGALDSDSKSALAVIKTQMPRLAGEVGNLNQTEQDIWEGSQSLADRASQIATTMVNSQITPENKEELRKILGVFLNEANTSKTSILDSSVNSMELLYSVPAPYMKNVYGEQRKITPRMQDVMSGDFKQPDNKPKDNLVERKTSDGRIGLFDPKTKQFVRWK